MFVIHFTFLFFLNFFLSKPFLPFVAWDLSLGNWMTPFLCKSGRYRSSNWRRPSHKYLKYLKIPQIPPINTSSQQQKFRKIRVYRACRDNVLGKTWFLISNTGTVDTNCRFHWLALPLSFHFIVIVEILVGQFSLKFLTIRTVALTTFKVIMF